MEHKDISILIKTLESRLCDTNILIMKFPNRSHSKTEVAHDDITQVASRHSRIASL